MRYAILALLFAFPLHAQVAEKPVQQQTKPQPKLKPDDVLYRTSQFTLWAGTGLDFVSGATIDQKRYHEANIGIGRPGQAAVMFGTAALVSYLGHYLKQNGHRRAATILLFCGGGVHVGAAVHNFRVQEQ